ncbi:hypothetical protein BAE44_0021769 [Dichanthelium oligosanthes]|uniref:Uncharacterized protein n=1 Tax=Dichanthelium oligosanthes TaxID=888268 RepID=A0A1E5UWG8_9POAL|nr:hypothetical protein BAE44_0021769 [Dichanthelium oligosanthes]
MHRRKQRQPFRLPCHFSMLVPCQMHV